MCNAICKTILGVDDIISQRNPAGNQLSLALHKDFSNGITVTEDLILLSVMCQVNFKLNLPMYVLTGMLAPLKSSQKMFFCKPLPEKGSWLTGFGTE